MGFFKTTAVCAIAFGLAGCVGPLSGATTSSEPPAASLSSVTVLDALPAKASVVGDITAVSCKNKMWDAAPSKGDALEILKGKASKMGANAIVDVRYDDGSVSLITNCWATVTAAGKAVKTAPAR